MRLSRVELMFYGAENFMVLGQLEDSMKITTINNTD